jgi:hypothetical protein
MNKALQIGLTAYYDGELYDEETGTLIPENVSKLGLSLDDIDSCMQWLGAYQDYHANDTVRYGCDCGCGGDTLDWDYEDKMKAQALEEMNRIEKLLGTPPEEYL